MKSQVLDDLNRRSIKVEKKVEVVEIKEPEPDPKMSTDIHNIFDVIDDFKPE